MRVIEIMLSIMVFAHSLILAWCAYRFGRIREGELRSIPIDRVGEVRSIPCDRLDNDREVFELETDPITIRQGLASPAILIDLSASRSANPPTRREPSRADIASPPEPPPAEDEPPTGPTDPAGSILIEESQISADLIEQAIDQIVNPPELRALQVGDVVEARIRVGEFRRVTISRPPIEAFGSWSAGVRGLFRNETTTVQLCDLRSLPR